jgi:hypothetical protein
MWTTPAAYVNAVKPLLPRYEETHRWMAWDIPANIISSWRIYKRHRPLGMPFILLGDTKIRKMPELVRNFGFASGGLITDRDDAAMIERLRAQHLFRKQGLPRIGNGAILSDANWSPLLNDALILGGVHRGVEFHLADDRFAAMQPLVSESVSRFGGARPGQPAGAPAAADPAARWRSFFRRTPDVLMDTKGKVPRVLAREIIGLGAFGYSPRFSEQQLTFVCTDHPRARHASFDAYLAALDEAGMFVNARERILGALATILFGQPKALL